MNPRLFKYEIYYIYCYKLVSECRNFQVKFRLGRNHPSATAQGYFYVQDPDKLIACTMNFNYTASVILRLSELFLDTFILNFQQKCV